MIAIAGGSGYVGRYLAEALSFRDDILILDRRVPDFPLAGNIRFVEADLAEEDLSAYMTDVDTVLHLAAESDVRRMESSHHDTYQTTRFIVDAMEACGIGRLLFFSSSAVYGNNGWDADESTQCNPVSEYARDKLRSESLILGTDGIQSAILRFSNICGGAVRHGAVYDFCRKLYDETGAFVTPGSCFEEEHSMRIGYGSDTETLKEGLKAISRFTEELCR